MCSVSKIAGHWMAADTCLAHPAAGKKNEILLTKIKSTAILSLLRLVTVILLRLLTWMAASRNVVDA
jgi:hypothetical protein